MTVMSYTKFFFNKRFRGSQQPHQEYHYWNTKTTNIIQRMDNSREKRKISPKGGMAKWVLWRELTNDPIARIEEHLTRNQQAKFEQKRTRFGFPIFLPKIQTLTPFLSLSKPSPLSFSKLLLETILTTLIFIF